MRGVLCELRGKVRTGMGRRRSAGGEQPLDSTPLYNIVRTTIFTLTHVELFPLVVMMGVDPKVR